MSELVVGSRGSKLALQQTQMVIDQLVMLNPGITCRIEIIHTLGDKVLDVALAKIGDKGLFVKEIEQAMLEGEIDLAVHSAKDLPSDMNNALCIGAYPERVDPSDALVSKVGKLSELPKGSVIGTSSVRRRAQILHTRPDLEVADLRGNLDTRLRKLNGTEYDAVILAYAGLRRMGLESQVTEILPFDICLPAVGQGALAIQCRCGDSIESIVAKLDHDATRRCVTAERSLLSRMGAGCQTPVGALGRIIESELKLDAVVASLDGKNVVRMSETGDIACAEEIGIRLAERLLDSDAREFLAEVKKADLDGMGAA